MKIFLTINVSENDKVGAILFFSKGAASENFLNFLTILKAFSGQLFVAPKRSVKNLGVLTQNLDLLLENWRLQCR